MHETEKESRMQKKILSVTENRQIASQMMQMRLEGDGLMFSPGQFLNLKLDGCFLRRPISVADATENEVTILYKIVGRGTGQLAEIRPGAKLDVLCSLGNGYDLCKAGSHPLLVGGGAGVPPLYFLARKLREQGLEVTVVMGFGSAADVFYVSEFERLGCRVSLATVDGSAGMRGFVTDLFPESYSYIYTCGPLPMLKAVYDKSRTSGQFSFEERMGCGFGACMGCTCKTKSGPKRICREGPVLEKEEIVWDD